MSEAADSPPGRCDRFALFNEFIDRGQAHLRKLGCGSAVTLWVTLWRFENSTTGTARPGSGTLARCLGTNRRNVQRMLLQLAHHGYLVVVNPGKRGRGSSATYRLQVPDEKCVATTPIKPPKAARKKLVTTTHIESENASSVTEKCVTTTHEQKEQKKDIPADAGPAGSTQRKAPQRRPLFDAIAEVTGSAVQAARSHIGKVEKALKEEEPPFSPEEVREFGRRFWELCPWAARDNRQRPELGELQKHIGKVRTVKKTAATSGRPSFGIQPDFTQRSEGQ